MTRWKHNLVVPVAVVTAGLLLGACAETNGQAELDASPDTRATTTSTSLFTTRTTQSTTTTTSHQAIWLKVKYRPDPVDVGVQSFEYLNTSGSSLVTGAWYDPSAEYLIIGLNGTYYHYCQMPESSWQSFMAAESFGAFYNASIKGRYDCQLTSVPPY